MPVLKNPRHEFFARFIAPGKKATAEFSPGKDSDRSLGAAQFGQPSPSAQRP
jgi:hypothetical protein